MFEYERYLIVNNCKIRDEIYLSKLNYYNDDLKGNILIVTYKTEDNNVLNIHFSGRIISYRKRIENASLKSIEGAQSSNIKNRFFKVENSVYIKQLDCEAGGDMITSGYDPVHFIIIDNDDDVIDVVLTSKSPEPKIIIGKI